MSQKNASWQEYTIPNEPSLRGISVWNKDLIMVSGSHGAVGKTIDGGATWQVLSVDEGDSLDFRDVAILSETDIVLMSAGPGELSNIFNSKDGGESWEKVKTNSQADGFYDGMAFWNANEGILGGDPINGKLDLMITEDGGANWQTIQSNLLPKMNQDEFGGFAASGSHLTVYGQSIWVGTGGAISRVFYSPDKGKNWQAIETPIIQGEGSQGIFSIDFISEKVGVAVGGDYTKESEGINNVILTSDGGLTWQLAKNFPVYQSAVRYINSNQLVSVGPAACYLSNDGGETWQKISDQGYHTLAIGKDGSIWAAGRNGRIGHLTYENE